MKLSLSLVFLSLAAVANAAPEGVRGIQTSDEVKQVQCPVAGSDGEDTCLGATDENGDPCVWCSVSTFGFCVDEVTAEAIKEKLPIVTCSDDGGEDDDEAPVADDDTPIEDDDAPIADDDDAPAGDDDSVAPDYWKCLKDASTESDCEGLGCTWCTTKAGYGLCMNSDEAAEADKGDWFQCGGDDASSSLADPYDMTCVIQSAEADSEICKTTMDADGEACQWCSLQAHEFCLSAEQAAIFEQIGASCDDAAVLADIQDTSCLLVTLDGESACESAEDVDGNPCQFCSLSSYELCLNEDQAALVEQAGGDCSDQSEDQPETSVKTA